MFHEAYEIVERKEIMHSYSAMVHHQPGKQDSPAMPSIELALSRLDLFQQWAIEKAATNCPIGQPGRAEDCPICHYVRDITGRHISIGVDVNHQGIWWVAENTGPIHLLPTSFETVRQFIDSNISITADILVNFFNSSL
jgi:hypothetical protein